MFFGCFRRCLEHLWENGKKTNLRLNFWDDNYQNGHQFANNISQICFHLFCVRLKVAKHCGGCPTVPSPSVIHQAVVTCLPCQTHGIQCHFLRKYSAKVRNHFGRLLLLLCSLKGSPDIFGLKMFIVKNKNSAELTTLCFRRKPESNSRRELLTNKCQKPETKRNSNTKNTQRKATLSKIDYKVSEWNWI